MTGVRRSLFAVILMTSVTSVACGGDESSVETLPLMTAAPTVPPTTPAPITVAPAAEEFYTIQQGDTLSRIAQSFGVSVSDLIAYNGIANPDSIQAGQRLKIPPSTQPSTTPPEPTTDESTPTP